jgi:hypothetical protein
MKANLTNLKFAALALVAIAGTAGAVACSSDDTNSGGPTIDAGTPDTSASSSGASSGGSSGASSGASSSGSSSGATDAGSDAHANTTCTSDASQCNSCGTVATDPYNTCSNYGCAGAYNNASHGVPSPLPSL